MYLGMLTTCLSRLGSSQSKLGGLHGGGDADLRCSVPRKRYRSYASMSVWGFFGMQQAFTKECLLL